MNENQDEPNDSDPRVLEAAREYLAELEAGQVPDRSVYLMRDPDLASELEEFFDGLELAHAAGEAFKIFEAGVEHDRTAPVVEPLGDFRIVREIGRGGMGVVYEAVQMSLGRRVALKVLPFAAGLDARHLQRFRTEAHAAAQLHHTGIVPVYAVGCERGVHFYAMQLIDGNPLDAVIRELRGERFGHRHDVSTIDFRAGPTASPVAPPPTVTSQTNRNREAYRHAASMAMQAAEALEYAHDAGVVHRDIKPANLLLDAKGNVWVTDFGLAQVSADAGLTRTGDVVGTLRYMSPEQASGRRYLVDHRIDVYSLGATLYELLTLHPIFPGQDRQALLNQILNEEPRRPRDVDRGIPTELETVVLKAVAKAPEDRYRTAGEMAADLRRFLEDRPILARRPSLVDRGRKWLRRHPAYLGAAVLVLAFGVVGLAASTTLVLREQQRTEAALEREKQRAAEVEVRFELARRSADEMIHIADEELADNFGQWALRRRLLETAVAFYQELIDLRRDDPSAQAELEATRVRVEAILGDLQVIRGAERHVLLNRSDVQDELKLSAVQRAKLEPVFQKMGHGMPFPPRDNPPAPGRERSRQLLDEMRAHEAAIAAILTPAQLDRLGQLALQRRGVEAFREPEVVAELDLDHDQREQLREIPTGPMGGPRFGGPPEGRRGPPEWRHDGDRNFLRGPGGGPGGGPHWPMRDGPDGNAAMKRALKILRPDQRAAWQNLTGPTFEPVQAGPRNLPGGPR